MRSKIYEVYKVSANFVYFVCSASPNAILSQPAADSPFQKGPFGPAGDGRLKSPRREPGAECCLHFPDIGAEVHILEGNGLCGGVGGGDGLLQGGAGGGDA